ncbi:hypothetical protein HCB33_06185 [Listeria sp. FSL L7-0233]|uniref:hypothetical protein n=1 Tax=Listeria cossartiae TaxID=2838249 RepID=UPI0016298DD2|nr:hypothetical protein [Listeria cossartiae]MBC2182948.1 hypothetical protein [Listeria cossartiae subsp. cossartiae]MBC2190850.1 hypothetical protein [Listeria cossartiae subsp. cossartiae]
MKKIDNELFLRKDQFEGTMYVEFKYSSAKKGFWDEDSYYINSDIFEYLLDDFEKSKEDFSMFGENHFSFEEVDNLINKLKERDMVAISDSMAEKDAGIRSLSILVRSIESWLERAIELGVSVIILGV